MGVLKYIRGFLTPNLQMPRLHTEWRLLLIVIVFGAACAWSIARWEQGFIDLNVFNLIIVFILVTSTYILYLKYKITYVLNILLIFIVGIGISQARISFNKNSFAVPKNIVAVEGKITRLEYRPENLPTRFYIEPSKVGYSRENLPKSIRVLTRTTVDAGVRAGATVMFAAKLTKPWGPIVPGGYDFARTAFFRGIGAEAIAVTPIGLLDGDAKLPAGLIMRTRGSIEEAFLSSLEGQKAAVAIALTVGFRNHLSRETTDNLRKAGLSHLLAISGLHMGLVTVASFFIFELLFAAIPAIALRVMPKKAAVFPTFLIALLYLLLSGASTSTMRAFLMVAVALLAILADRRVVSLRSVALAAGAILLVWPEVVLSVGFQMSFAATAGLVAFYERILAFQRERKLAWFPRSRFWKVVFYVVGTGLTSIIAQTAIAPFALYHFQTLSLVGIVSNMLVLPVMSLLVMPLLLVALLSLPLGGLTLFEPILTYCFSYILDVSQMTAHMSYAVLETAVMSDVAFSIATLCFLCFLIIIDWRWSVGAFSLMVVALIFGKIDPADVLISSSGTVIAHNMAEGPLGKMGKAEKVEEGGGGIVKFSGGRAHSYRERSWQRYWNVNAQNRPEKLAKQCDRTACAIPLAGKGAIITIRALEAVKPACAAGNIVILPKRYSRYCKGSRLMLTKEDLENKGPLGLWFAHAGTIEKKWSR
ncbi:MAG: competence protein ComEC family protein [Kordiimonadaceae bacterium]|nr:competence protein ComEC family protein [Kordiimonadaceae bacterium]